MAAINYVEITREMFEDWLSSLHNVGSKGFSRVPGKAGLYLIHFSDLVSVLASSSIGNENTAMGKDKGAMYLRLVARKTFSRVLNKKAINQSKFYRTTNWKTTLTKAVKTFHDVYMDGKEWYDRLASVEDPLQYKKDWMEKIQRAPGLATNLFLKDLLAKVEGGTILSQKQQQAIEKALEKTQDTIGPQVSRGPVRQVDQPNIQPSVDPVLVQGLELINLAMSSSFSESLLDQARRGRALSPKQQSALQGLEDQFLRYLAAVGTNARAEDKPFLRTIYRKFKDATLMTPDEVRQFREIAMPGRQAHLVDIPLAVREVDIPVTRWVDIPVTA